MMTKKHMFALCIVVGSLTALEVNAGDRAKKIIAAQEAKKQQDKLDRTATTSSCHSTRASKNKSNY